MQVAPGDHVCAIHANAEEQVAIVGSFFRAGLRRGARCCYVAHARSSAEISGMLQAAGIEVRRERRRGTLLVLSARDAYLPGGRFDLDATIGRAEEFAHEAGRSGFDGVYAAAEMTWALGGDPGCERLVEYEARVAPVFRIGTVAGLCQYDRRRFPPEMLREAVRTHPLVAFDTGVCANRFFEPEAACAASSAAASSVHQMLAQIETGAVAAHGPGPTPRSVDRVLVIERNTMLREALTLAFQHYGYGVMSAASWGEATELVRSEGRPRLILLGLSPTDVVQQPTAIESDALAPVPAIVLSGGELPPGVAQLRTVAAILPKTASLEEIMSVVERCLRRRTSGPVILPS